MHPTPRTDPTDRPHGQIKVTRIFEKHFVNRNNFPDLHRPYNVSINCENFGTLKF